MGYSLIKSLVGELLFGVTESNTIIKETAAQHIFPRRPPLQLKEYFAGGFHTGRVNLNLTKG